MYKVYWSDDDYAGNPFSANYEKLSEALEFTECLRRLGHIRFITMSCENPNQVGKMGVDSVKDGKLPNGEPYTYMKRRTS